MDTDNPSRPWLGADQPFHFFTTQDLFDPNKVDRSGGGYKFTSRLFAASTNASTYDQYTYYRLLSQLGTDSAPDDTDRLNLNYKNTDGLNATNFVPWTPLDFFTNAAQRLLAKYTQEWLTSDANYYTNFFGTNQAFGITRIPVLTTNGFVYTPSVNRLLQIAANLVDTKTTIFGRRFSADLQPGQHPAFHHGLRAGAEIPPSYLILQRQWRRAQCLSGPDPGDPHINVYGVPWVVGARKGCPTSTSFPYPVSH